MSAKTKGVPFSSKFFKGIGSLLLQTVATTTNDPESCSILELSSVTKGFLPPRMTTAQRTAITAVEGLVVYDLTLHKLHVYTDRGWEEVTSVSPP